MRTARSRTSGENRFDVFFIIAPPSQAVEPPANPARFRHIDPHGFDSGKLIKGKKRHVLVDTLGLLLHALVTSADIQDRDGGLFVLSTLFGQFPFLKKLFADSA